VIFPCSETCIYRSEHKNFLWTKLTKAKLLKEEPKPKSETNSGTATNSETYISDYNIMDLYPNIKQHFITASCN
jgi:hypothetical protein